MRPSPLPRALRVAVLCALLGATGVFAQVMSATPSALPLPSMLPTSAPSGGGTPAPSVVGGTPSGSGT